MTTPVQQKIRDKKRTPQQILDMVKSGDWIQPGSVGGDSTECMKELAKRIGPNLKDIELWNYAKFFPPPRIPGSRPQAGISIASMSTSSSPGTARPAIPTTSPTGRTGDGRWVCGSTITASSMPSRRNAGSTGGGTRQHLSTSTGLPISPTARTMPISSARPAKKTVIEVRSDYPWAEGGRFNTINIDDIDYWVEVDCREVQMAPDQRKGHQGETRRGSHRQARHDDHAGQGHRPARNRLAPVRLRQPP